jgi:hypothetical protein
LKPEFGRHKKHGAGVGRYSCALPPGVKLALLILRWHIVQMLVRLGISASLTPFNQLELELVLEMIEFESVFGFAWLVRLAVLCRNPLVLFVVELSKQY